MLTLEQAIAHCEQKAEELREQAEKEKQCQVNKVKMLKGIVPDISEDLTKKSDCLECAEEHAQLAAWLKELQVYRETDNGDVISRKNLLERIDKEREYLKARGLFGAEHILIHNFRELVEEAQPVVPSEIYMAGYHAGFYAVHGEPEVEEEE